jgi:hypothetical protein
MKTEGGGAREKRWESPFGIAKNPGPFGNGRASRRCGNRQDCLRRKWSKLPRIPQPTLSFYEREAGDILAGLAPPMARALSVSVDELLGETEKKRRAAVGPTGRMRRLFEAASKLPRSQQEKIAAVQSEKGPYTVTPESPSSKEVESEHMSKSFSTHISGNR